MSKWENLERRDTFLQPEGINLDKYVYIGDEKTEVIHREPDKFWGHKIPSVLTARY